MVVGAFPAAKLGVLALKQIAKPVANVIKSRAKSSPFFRKYICMPPAQFYNWCEVKTKMWALNLGKPTAVPQLSEAMAIELGANLLGEVVIFVFGAGVLLFEYQRQSNKEHLKEQLILQEKAELQAMLNELAFQAERQDAQIRELTRVVADLDSKSWVNPTKIVDMVTGKKKPQIIKNDEDNPLELLPEKRTKARKFPKDMSNDINNKSTQTTSDPNLGSLYRSLSFLIDDLKLLNYSDDTAANIIEQVTDNAFERAVNDLFFDEDEITGVNDDNRDRFVE